jgi:membrane-bound serine protease (ClpP class)
MPEPAKTAQVIYIKGGIGPATAEFIEEGFEKANDNEALLIIFAIDTPGGLATSMRSIIRKILESTIPVAVFVSPSGARAASAGTYILYASHIAAMAPGTNLGAATPIAIGGGEIPVPKEEKEEPPAEQGEAPGQESSPQNPMAAKMVNDAAAYIRSLAQMRGRNVEWAEQAVRNAASLTAEEALEKGVIDLMAADIDDLLMQVDGRTVTIGDRKIQMQTAGLNCEIIEPDWRNRLLAILTNPNIAFILILAGIYGLLFEFSNPGFIGPGVVGAICLLLGFYALNVLPLNYAGLGLLLLAIALMAAEAFVPSFGILGIGGIVAFVLAALMLFKSDIPGFRISWPVIIGTAIASIVMLIFVLGYVWRAQRRPVTTGSEGMRGREAVVLEWSGNRGYVSLGGERWKAAGEEDVAPHDRVEIRERSGLLLVVKKKRS